MHPYFKINIRFKNLSKSPEAKEKLKIIKPAKALSNSRLKNHRDLLVLLTPSHFKSEQSTRSPDYIANLQPRTTKSSATPLPAFRSATPNLEHNSSNQRLLQFFRRSQRRSPCRATFSKFQIKKQDTCFPQSFPPQCKYTDTKSGNSWALDSASDQFLKQIQNLKQKFNLPY